MNQAIIGTADQIGGSVGVVGIPVRQQLDAFVAGLDTDLEERRKDLTRAEALVADKKALCAAFPEDLPLAPQNLVISSNIVYKADAALTFVVTSRDEVLRLQDALPGVPVVMVEAGSTAFVPEERFVKKEGQRDSVTPVGELVYRLSTWVDNLQEEYSWWTRLGNKLVHVTAKTQKGQAPVAKAKATIRALIPTIHEVTWNYENLPGGELLRWYGGDSRNVVPVTVHQSRGLSFREAVATPMKASAKVKAKHCDC
jgi:hypothetical protein